MRVARAVYRRDVIIAEKEVQGIVDGFFEIVAAMAVATAAAGVAVLLVWNHHRVHRQGETRLLAAGVALILIGAGLFVLYDVRTNTIQFSYSVTLTPNGTGMVRISLPVPIDPTLIANLASSPSTSSAALNQSGREPVLDVTMTERTTVTASSSRYRYSGPIAMSNADGYAACSYGSPNTCNATVAMIVVAGNVSEVRVQVRAMWSRPCYTPDWELEAMAAPGERSYPTYFGAIVC